MGSVGSESQRRQASGASALAARVKWKFVGLIVWRFDRDDEEEEEEEG